jgi:hypothetical protein
MTSHGHLTSKYMNARPSVASGAKAIKFATFSVEGNMVRNVRGVRRKQMPTNEGFCPFQLEW